MFDFMTAIVFDAIVCYTEPGRKSHTIPDVGLSTEQTLDIVESNTVTSKAGGIVQEDRLWVLSCIEVGQIL